MERVSSWAADTVYFLLCGLGVVAFGRQLTDVFDGSEMHCRLIQDQSNDWRDACLLSLPVNRNNDRFINNGRMYVRTYVCMHVSIYVSV